MKWCSGLFDTQTRISPARSRFPHWVRFEGLKIFRPFFFVSFHFPFWSRKSFETWKRLLLNLQFNEVRAENTLVTHKTTVIAVDDLYETIRLHDMSAKHPSKHLYNPKNKSTRKLASSNSSWEGMEHPKTSRNKTHEGHYIQTFPKPKPESKDLNLNNQLWATLQQSRSLLIFLALSRWETGFSDSPDVMGSAGLVTTCVAFSQRLQWKESWKAKNRPEICVSWHVDTLFFLSFWTCQR